MLFFIFSRGAKCKLSGANATPERDEHSTQGPTTTLLPTVASGDSPLRQSSCSSHQSDRTAALVQDISNRMQKEECRTSAVLIAKLGENACRGLLSMPDDLRPDPTCIHLTIARIKACLPATSPFETVASARADLDVAQQQYRDSGLLREGVPVTKRPIGWA